ncbi:MAG: single-stranded-DNA-specific exonuclease RecJ [Chitinophagaceae bacterium]
MPTITALEKRWTLKEVDSVAEVQLREDLPTINPIFCKMLASRGIKNYAEAKAFFRPQLTDLHDPFLMKGMSVAVERISQAIEWHERILVYGDYDVDGTTAVAVVFSFLREAYPNGDISFYIPHRYREGYGVSKAGIDFAKDNAYTLLITLDCGIKSTELVNYANKLGIDVIICDHHLPDENLPPALAILNPKQSDCSYPYKELCGCGIGFKLIQALSEKLGLPEEKYTKYLDLVATSIASDIVPIDGENRTLAFFGIEMVNEAPCLSIKTLVGIAGIKKKLTVTDLVFVIGPRVNAAGRMDDARKAVDLFIETDPERCIVRAEALHSDNFDRKEVDRNITEEALSMLQADALVGKKKSTVLYQPHWHKGVVGIVASRVIEHYYRPTIVLTLSNGKVTGSARSIRGFNIYEAIHECSDLLENYGGHFFAAGMTMKPENVVAFQEKFEAVVSRTITPELLIPEIIIDAEINFADIKPSFFNIMSQFEPFGPANMRPVFLTRRVIDFRASSKIVKENHLRFVVQQGIGGVMEGIGFNLAHLYPYLQEGPVDVVYTLEENEYNGNVKLQLKVLDLRPSKQFY